MIIEQSRRKSINAVSALWENPWPVIKPIAGHLGADYGMQSYCMATQKNGCILWRLAHIGVVAVAHVAVALTIQASAKDRAEYVIFNVVTHYAADCMRLPKWVDQVIHLGAAVYSGLRWLRKDV